MKETIVNPTHSFELADVEKYGSIEKALLIKEIRSLQVYKQRSGKNGWVYYSANALAEKFPYMKRRSIDRWMKELIADGHLESCVRNKAAYDRTLSYRVPGISTVGQNMKMSLVKMANENGQNGLPIPSHSTSHSTSHSSGSNKFGLTKQQKRNYALAVLADKDQAIRAVRSRTRTGSTSSVGAIMGGKRWQSL